MKQIIIKILRWRIQRLVEQQCRNKVYNSHGKKCFRRRILDKYFDFLFDSLIKYVGKEQLYYEMYGVNELLYDTPWDMQDNFVQ